MKKTSLMKNATIKSGLFSKSLREIMAEKMENARGLWYKAGAKYSLMPTFKLKTSDNVALRSLGSIAEAYGVKIIATTAFAAAFGYVAVELLHPEQAFAAEVDGVSVTGDVVNVTDAGSAEVAASPTTTDSPISAETSDYDNPYGVDLSGVDGVYRDENGQPFDPDQHDQDAAKENLRTEPDTTPDTEPDTEPDTTPKTEPDTTPKTEPGTTPGTEPKQEYREAPRTEEEFNVTIPLIGSVLAAGAAVGAKLKKDAETSNGLRMAVYNGRPTYEFENTKSGKNR